MKTLKENIRPLLLILLIPIMNISYLLINKFSGTAHDITIMLDSYIPFSKYFVIPYIIWYAYVPVAFILLCLKDKKSYYKALFAYSIGCVIASIIFLLYQTTVPRTQISGDDILTKIMLLIYSNDKPVNCLPSLHVFTCYLIMRVVPVSSLASLRNNVVTSVLSILIILSTLFTKQHAVLDVITGMLLFEMINLPVNRYENQLKTFFIASPLAYFHHREHPKELKENQVS